jgi:hypothetical protein
MAVWAFSHQTTTRSSRSSKREVQGHHCHVMKPGDALRLRDSCGFS